MKNSFKRTSASRVETRALSDAEKSAGYIGVLTGIIPLNSDSVLLRDRRLNNGQPFVERIAPKAFSDAADVMAMAGHTDETLAAFARQGVNLALSESATELRWEALLPNTQAGRDLAELGPKIDAQGKVVREGVIRGTSFEFEVGADDKWEKRADGTSVRIVTRGTLTAVNPVIWPAYAESELSVSMRSGGAGQGEARGYYVYQDSDFTWTDSTVTPDSAFALAAIGAATCTLSESLRYLREQPAGALVELARAQVANAAATVTTLAAWLAANGATINPEAQQRAAARLAEARAAAQPISHADHDRERRYRILQLSSR